MKKTTYRPLYILVFLSGFAGLLYQVLWMRQLGLLFGNTAHAAAATLAAFFAGLAGGSWFWGRRSEKIRQPLRTYAFLEFGIAGSALLYFAILKLFHGIYPGLYQALGTGASLLLVKGILALLLVFPPAFFMGGTIPVLGKFMIQRREQFGTTAAWLYGLNTIGAAMGALLTGFVLAIILGFNLTCAVGIAITVSIGLSAFTLSRKHPAVDTDDETSEPMPQTESKRKSRKEEKKGKNKKAKVSKGEPATAHWLIYSLAFISGFSVLALEVLWTRMFAQVHENSVYSFSAVLVIVLICLAAGALISSRLAKRASRPIRTLLILTVLSGISISISPFIFMKLTNNLQMLPVDNSFSRYLLHLITTGFLTIGPPCLILGTVFPFLMKSEEAYASQPGKSIGNLSAVNTGGAILGSLACGFIFLEHMGMWGTMQLFTAVYLIVGLALPAGNATSSLLGKACALLFLVLSFTTLSPGKLPVVGTNPKHGQETIVETWETSESTVAVVKNEFGDYTIKVNSSYNLGSTGALMTQIYQTRIPLFAYPQTETIFYLGMGTGITAGDALDTRIFSSVKQVTVCELSPQVVIAAKKYIAGGNGGPDFTNGLFNDPRATILAEDGRHYLMATDNTFDMINADLFLPYRSGAGSLYSIEHFRQVKERLKPNGVFVQWLPLYQVTQFEFGVVIRTMLEVFDQVTLWRNNFQPGVEKMAIMGHKRNAPLPACDRDFSAEKRLFISGSTYNDGQTLEPPANEKTVTLFYCGNLSACRELVAEFPVNTDDKPVIEYKTPRSLHKKDGELPPQFVGPKLADFVDKIFKRIPPSQDPFLQNRTEENQRLPLAGAAFHRAWISIALRDMPAWKESWARFVDEWLNKEPDK